ncbi:MAG TPA: serine hydrolase domain-containing protein [Thermomicrobiaceae bacterium]|nr:serine hydrolase domain-containing protein [Thermomicrobiaceae bacterium]
MVVAEAGRAEHSERAERVDALFAEWDRSDSPGCALGVVQGGELVYARGYGMANLDLGVAITPASVFHVASVSKQFTAITVALLAREGKLALDDDVRRYVPELPDFGRRITLRHLINHTSGLRDQYGLFRLAGWREGDVQTFGDVIAFALRHRRLNFEPGAEYAYCNTSYTLLALTVERVTDQRFADVVRERILEPLDMAHSHLHDDVTRIVPNRASAYAPREGGGFKVANSNVDALGAICLHTSVEDLARWLRNFRERSVAGEVLDEAVTPGRLNDGTPLRYAHGLQIGEYRGLKTVSHGGVDAGYRAEMLWFPEADFGVVVLANLASIRPGALARRVADLWLGDRLGRDELLDAEAVPLPEAEQARLVGLYRDPHTSLTRRIRLEDDKLTVNGPFGERVPMTPLGGGRFRVGDPAQEVRVVTGPDGTRAFHEVSPDGQATVYPEAEAAAPPSEVLAGYAGTYRCPEIETSYTLLVRDGTLILRHRRMAERALAPTIADAFTVPPSEFDVVFSRDGRGDVDGFDLFSPRIRYLRFERAE